MGRMSWSHGSWVSWVMGHVGHRSQNMTHCQLLVALCPTWHIIYFWNEDDIRDSRKSDQIGEGRRLTLLLAQRCRREAARLCLSLKPWNVPQGSPLKVIENGTIRNLGYGILFAFHSNCDRIFRRFDTIHERDRHPPTQPDTARRQEPRYTASLGCRRAAKKQKSSQNISEGAGLTTDEWLQKTRIKQNRNK